MEILVSFWVVKEVKNLKLLRISSDLAKISGWDTPRRRPDCDSRAVNTNVLIPNQINHWISVIPVGVFFRISSWGWWCTWHLLWNTIATRCPAHRRPYTHWSLFRFQLFRLDKATSFVASSLKLQATVAQWFCCIVSASVRLRYRRCPCYLTILRICVRSPVSHFRRKYVRLNWRLSYLLPIGR